MSKMQNTLKSAITTTNCDYAFNYISRVRKNTPISQRCVSLFCFEVNKSRVGKGDIPLDRCEVVLDKVECVVMDIGSVEVGAVKPCITSNITLSYGFWILESESEYDGPNSPKNGSDTPGLGCGEIACIGTWSESESSPFGRISIYKEQHRVNTIEYNRKEEEKQRIAKSVRIHAMV